MVIQRLFSSQLVQTLKKLLYCGSTSILLRLFFKSSRDDRVKIHFGCQPASLLEVYRFRKRIMVLRVWNPIHLPTMPSQNSNTQKYFFSRRIRTHISIEEARKVAGNSCQKGVEKKRLRGRPLVSQLLKANDVSPEEQETEGARRSRRRRLKKTESIEESIKTKKGRFYYHSRHSENLPL